MATYYENCYYDQYYHPVGGGDLVWQTTSRQYANADVVRYFSLVRDTKICEATIMNAQLDSHATPTIAATLRTNDGTTQQNIMTLTAAAALAVADGRADMNVAAALGYVIPAAGYWLELLFTAGPATAAAGIIYVRLKVTNVMFQGEGPVTPTG
jgi:hypothetical protein